MTLIRQNEVTDPIFLSTMPRLPTLIIISLLYFAIAIPAICQDAASEDKPKRPKVGLVLSGGGAKGFAYIGLLKVLEEVEMPIDYIGGSSIGAIIAALYASGYSPETIEDLICEEDWDKQISDKLEREYVAYEEKLFSDKYIFSVPIQKRKISISTSISGSFNIDLLLNKLYAPVSNITDFNELPIPFICIGTDLFTGEEVIMDCGNIARAVRASMSLPGYFAPTYYQGTYMVDGGVVNNYPAQQIKAMGAEYIIGGDVQSIAKTNIDELNTVTGILNQVISFHRTDAYKKGRSITDYYIHFKMPYNMMDFSEHDSIIALGERVSNKHYSNLKALADSLNNIEAYIKVDRNTKPIDSLVIKEINWSKEITRQSEKIGSFFEGISGNKTSFSEIEKRMKLIQGTKSFTELHYELETDTANNTFMTIKTSGANQGSLAAGVHYDNVYNGSILVNLTLRNIFGSNSKLFTDLVLSQNPRLYSLYMINNGFKPGFGFEVDLYSFGFPQYDNGEKTNQWHIDNLSAAVFMPLTFKNAFAFRAGFKYEYFRFRQDVAIDTTLDAYNTFTDYGNLYIAFKLDTRDKVYFTNKGSLIELKGKYVFPFSDNWNDYGSSATLFYLKFKTNIKLPWKFVFRPGIFAGYTIKSQNTPPLQHLFGLGGLNPVNYVENHIPFTGLRFIESFGLYTGIIRAQLQYNFLKNFYATLLGDAGINEMDSKDFHFDNTLFGYGIKLSYSSFIGPVELSVMGSNENNITFFLNIGFWF